MLQTQTTFNGTNKKQDIQKGCLRKRFYVVSSFDVFDVFRSNDMSCFCKFIISVLWNYYIILFQFIIIILLCHYYYYFYLLFHQKIIIIVDEKKKLLLIITLWGPLSTKVLRLHSTGYLSTTNNQACVPANPEVDRKISYI